MKVLYCYFQPKIIPEVLEQLQEINCDKLILKFIKYPDVYLIAMKYLREHPQYTHFFWHSNDTVIPNDDFRRLCQTMDEKDLDVLGMACNVDLSEDGMNLIACSLKPVSVNHGGNIEWIKRGEIENLSTVAFNGCPQLIKREVLINCPLRGADRLGFNCDVQFSNDLRDYGYSTWVDFSYKILHLRYKGDLLVNKRAPEIVFIPCK